MFISNIKLVNATRIELTDWSDYKSELSCNGGCYAFEIVYKKISDKEWEVSHSTSSEFPYCPKMGYFCSNSCSNCTAEFEIVKTEDVEKIVNEFINNPLEDHTMEIYMGSEVEPILYVRR